MRETEKERDFFKHGLVRDERDKKSEKILKHELVNDEGDREREREKILNTDL